MPFYLFIGYQLNYLNWQYNVDKTWAVTPKGKIFQAMTMYWEYEV